jgi:hypothetical protein
MGTPGDCFIDPLKHSLEGFGGCDHGPESLTKQLKKNASRNEMSSRQSSLFNNILHHLPMTPCYKFSKRAAESRISSIEKYIKVAAWTI